MLIPLAIRSFLNVKSNTPFSCLDVPDNKSVPDVINEFFVSVSEDLEPVKREVVSTLSDDYWTQYTIYAQDVDRRFSYSPI